MYQYLSVQGSFLLKGGGGGHTMYIKATQRLNKFCKEKKLAYKYSQSEACFSYSLIHVHGILCTHFLFYEQIK